VPPAGFEPATPALGVRIQVRPICEGAGGSLSASPSRSTFVRRGSSSLVSTRDVSLRKPEIGPAAQERPPAWVAAACRCRRDPGFLEDPADRGRGDPVAELAQLALDPLVAPRGVVPRELFGERGGICGQRRASAAARVGPLARDQARRQRRIANARRRRATAAAGRDRRRPPSLKRTVPCRRAEGRGMSRPHECVALS
jgi:hypothetical protein